MMLLMIIFRHFLRSVEKFPEIIEAKMPIVSNLKTVYQESGIESVRGWAPVLSMP